MRWGRFFRPHMHFCMSRLILILLGLPGLCTAACIPFNEASKYLGETTCVTGKVLRVTASPRSGTHFLNFCDDLSCPFTVVVFASDLDKVGDVRTLSGTVVEIYGRIREYRGGAEIVLSSVKQLRGDAAKLPPLPRHYDVATRGNQSAGKFRSGASKKSKRKSRNRRTTDEREGEADPSAPEDD